MKKASEIIPSEPFDSLVSCRWTSYKTTSPLTANCYHCITYWDVLHTIVYSNAGRPQSAISFYSNFQRDWEQWKQGYLCRNEGKLFSLNNHRCKIPNRLPRSRSVSRHETLLPTVKERCVTRHRTAARETKSPTNQWVMAIRSATTSLAKGQSILFEKLKHPTSKLCSLDPLCLGSLWSAFSVLCIPLFYPCK